MTESLTGNNPFPLPPHFKNFTHSVEQLIQDNPEYDKNVFVMMRFHTDQLFEEIHRAIQSALEEEGLKCLRADDKMYQDSLWENVCVYMLGCKYGIVVYEDIKERDFNPNITLETGFMLALGKRILFLKEARLPSIPTDIAGRLYRVFDAFNIHLSIKVQIQKWISDLNIGKPREDKLPLLEAVKYYQLATKALEGEGLGFSRKPPDIQEVIDVINRSLRLYFRQDPPENELQINQALKVVLSAAALDFIEEHPHIHFAGRSFRPDLSSGSSSIAIEVKLCRSQSQIRRIIAEIVADILPYKSQFNNVIFLIYDLGFISDENTIRRDIEGQDGVYLMILKH